MEPTFYLVYGLGKEAPKKSHETEEEADAEAQRLACANIGTTFIVLETRMIHGFCVDKPERIMTYDLRRRLDEYEERKDFQPDAQK